MISYQKNNRRKNMLYSIKIAILSMIILLAAGLTACADNSANVQAPSQKTTDVPKNTSEYTQIQTEAVTVSQPISTEAVTTVQPQTSTQTSITFRNEKLLNSHYEKHGIEMGFASAKDYEEAAAAVVSNTEALHKKEAEDGDDVYYIESTNEFVIVSTDGYIRTYFNPDAGISYYNRQ